MPKFPTYPDCFDECKQITITDLRRLGFLGPGAVASGSYRWTRGGKPSGSVSITTNMLEKFVQLDYCFNDGDPISYRIRLESLPKHFGGCEFYFICPATGKRCRTLYGIGKHFLSRSAYPSAMYNSQTQSKRWRALGAILGTRDENNRLYRKHAKKYYAGKPTKWFTRWLARTERRERFAFPLIRRLLE
jgi:hypothetical protein